MMAAEPTTRLGLGHADRSCRSVSANPTKPGLGNRSGLDSPGQPRDVVERRRTYGHCRRGAQRIELQALQGAQAGAVAIRLEGHARKARGLPCETVEAVPRFGTGASR